MNDGEMNMPETIVCFGDSITASGWPAVLETVLRRSGRAEVRCVNAGVRGNTTTQGLRRIEKDVIAHRPGLVTVEFGLNDCNVILNGPAPRTPPDRFRRNLIEIIGRIGAAGAQPLLLTNHRTMENRILPGGRSYEEHNERYSQIIMEVADGQEAALCDMRLLFPGHGLELKDTLDADRIHLNAAGLRAYGALVADAVLTRTPARAD